LVPACRVFVLKPMVLGGFLPTLRIARIGKARNMGLVVSHLFDGPIALAAAAELALALPSEPLACGLDRHAGLTAWPEIAIPQVRESEIRLSGHAGLGVRWPEGIT
ncbi:MAG: enolase C-terminal domain-like protein, partial [Candidatus Eisenbacteria bacterium]